jgi:2',3'-cyclic-nucleotide 2'-phosphodiesterase (5'-nucleotidase family)
MFPTSLTSLEFDTGVSDIQYFTAEATFKYLVYNIVDKDGRTRL